MHHRTLRAHDLRVLFNHLSVCCCPSHNRSHSILFISQTAIYKIQSSVGAFLSSPLYPGRSQWRSHTKYCTWMPLPVYTAELHSMWHTIRTCSPITSQLTVLHGHTKLLPAPLYPLVLSPDWVERDSAEHGSWMLGLSQICWFVQAVATVGTCLHLNAIKSTLMPRLNVELPQPTFLEIFARSSSLPRGYSCFGQLLRYSQLLEAQLKIRSLPLLRSQPCPTNHTPSSGLVFHFVS